MITKKPITDEAPETVAGDDSLSSHTPMNKRMSLPGGGCGSTAIGSADKEMDPCQYRERFNSSVRELFGPRPLKSISRRPQETPQVADLISRNVSWGKDIK
jgi:hypothetical protein